MSNGNLLTTINVKTIDNQENTSLFLLGQGIPDYGTDIAQDFVWSLENFAKSTPPVNPLIGQEWYDNVNDRMNFYTGTEWRYYIFAETCGTGLFTMSTAATNFDFTTTATTTIFSGTNTAKTYYPTELLLIPTGEFNATGSPTINLFVSSAGDVLSSTTIPIISSTKFTHIRMNESPVAVSGAGGNLHLQVTAGATGGQLNYNVLVFGAVIGA